MEVNIQNYNSITSLSGCVLLENKIISLSLVLAYGGQ